MGGDIDHFIPGPLSPRLGAQLLLAHSKCNAAKIHILADAPHLAVWVERNDRHRDALGKIFEFAKVLHDEPTSIRWRCRRMKVWPRREDSSGVQERPALAPREPGGVVLFTEKRVIPPSRGAEARIKPALRPTFLRIQPIGGQNSLPIGFGLRYRHEHQGVPVDRGRMPGHQSLANPRKVIGKRLPPKVLEHGDHGALRHSPD